MSMDSDKKDLTTIFSGSSRQNVVKIRTIKNQKL